MARVNAKFKLVVPRLTIKKNCFCGINLNFPLDKLWLQEGSSVGFHRETARHVPATWRRYVATLLPKLAAPP